MTVEQPPCPLVLSLHQEEPLDPTLLRVIEAMARAQAARDQHDQLTYIGGPFEPPNSVASYLF